jgi:hypothetical protein
MAMEAHSYFSAHIPLAHRALQSIAECTVILDCDVLQSKYQLQVNWLVTKGKLAMTMLIRYSAIDARLVNMPFLLFHRRVILL